MDFIAEILLKYSDELISYEIQKNTKLKEKFKILRYRDDYRIFVKEIEIGREIMKIITKVLSSLGLKLNTTKTGYYDDIILSSIKEDKLEYFERKKESNLQKRLISLYKFSLKYKNSGSVIKEISQMREIIEKKKDFSKENVEVLISIITEIIYKNPRTYLDGNTILSYLFPLIKEKERKESMKNFIKKFSTMVLSVAMLMTSGVILPSVSAANFKPIIEGSKWTSSDTVTVTFSDNVTLADDAKEKVVLTNYGQETPLNASDEVTASGKNVKIKLAGGYKYYSGLKFKAGALKSADGTPTTSDVVGYSISLDKGITSLSVADKNVPAEGKTVNVQVTGKNLDFGDPINLKVYAGSTKTNIEAKLVATSNRNYQACDS